MDVAKCLAYSPLPLIFEDKFKEQRDAETLIVNKKESLLTYSKGKPNTLDLTIVIGFWAGILAAIFELGVCRAFQTAK